MDLSSNKYLEASAVFSSNGGAILESKNGFCKNTSTKNPFLDSISDPLCKLNLKETSEFVKSFPVSNNTTQGRGFFDISAQRGTENVIKRNVEAPQTPGRPIFSFSNGNFSRKNFPSKWDDAEKWLSSCNDSPSNNLLKSMDTSRMFTKQCSGYKPHLGEVFAEKSRVTEEKVVKSDFNSARAINGVSLSAYPEVLLKENADKYSNEDNPIQERFLFGNSIQNPTNNATIEMVKHRDIGTEMTPLGSSTTSRCPTPFTSISPARHNTPANRSGPLALTSFDSSNTIDITQLQDCHLSKLNQFDSTWSTREEEEDDVSKSLRHFEMNSECRKSVSESRSCAWEDEVKTKRCLRYQREEAKIQAWVNLQSAKAEAESRKLEVKIQKMRSNLEEKLMKRMADVHRKAEEWRASAQFEHSEQIRKVDQQARKLMNRNKSHCSGYKSCGCFPCNNHQI